MSSLAAGSTGFAGLVLLALAAFATLAAAASFAASAYVLFFAAAGIVVGRREQRSAEQSRHPSGSNPATSFLILIPAHNEGAGLLPTLASLAACDYPLSSCRSIVIADNCTDSTAEVARSAGVEVWTRTDPSQPGKGQALAWAFRRAEELRPSLLPWQMLVVIDADTIVDPGFLAALDQARHQAELSGQRALALQGRYEFAPVADRPAAPRTARTGWFDSLTISSKAAENSFVYRPRSAFGMVTLLQGNGFAVSREALALAPFAAGSIVEDAEYALTLALAGVPVVYVDRALVLSRMTARIADAAPQRVRWAGGVFHLLAHAAPALLRAAARRRDWRLAEATVMLLLTSRLVLVYLTGVAALTFAAACALSPLSTPWLAAPAGLLLSAVTLQLAYLWMILRHAAPTPVPLRTILFLPAYLGFVAFAQAGAALGVRRGVWHRTAR